VTVGSQEKVDFCVNEMGATAGFNYNTQKWDEEVLKATGGKGVDLIVDFVGQNYFEQNLNAAARDAHIVHLGTLSGAKTKGPVDLSPFLRKRLRFEGSSLRSRDEEYQGRLRDQLVEHALPRFVDGRFKVLVEKIFPWEEIQKAHELLASNTTKGKVICTVD